MQRQMNFLWGLNLNEDLDWALGMDILQEIVCHLDQI